MALPNYSQANPEQFQWQTPAGQGSPFGNPAYAGGNSNPAGAPSLPPGVNNLQSLLAMISNIGKPPDPNAAIHPNGSVGKPANPADMGLPPGARIIPPEAWNSPLQYWPTMTSAGQGAAGPMPATPTPAQPQTKGVPFNNTPAPPRTAWPYGRFRMGKGSW